MFPVSLMLVFFFFPKLIITQEVLVDLTLQRFRHKFRAIHSIMRQIPVTKTTFVTHTELCHGVCCVYDSNTKSRPAWKTILFK